MAKIKTQYAFEKEERKLNSVKEKFKSGQIPKEVTVWALGLLGYSPARAKEVVKGWEAM